MHLPIYLDYAASTPVDKRVAEKMTACLTMSGNFANPASRSHVYGWQAEEAVELARGHVADLIGAEPREIVWTSGATEANNLAIKGIVEACLAKPVHIITSQIEHKSILDTCAYLEQQSVKVTYLQPDSDGCISADQVRVAITSETVLVSLMHVNNEVGVINPIAAIGELCREKQIIFHVDAAQSAGKLAIDLKKLPVDLMSFSAHKLYGPKGIGALYVNSQISQQPKAQIHGGGQERNRRSGTLPTHQLVGMGEAFQLAQTDIAAESKRIQLLRQRFLDKLCKMDGVVLNGSETRSVPGIINVRFSEVDGESLLLALKDIAVSTGSACTSAAIEPSYVLTAMGIEREEAYCSLRFSLGRYTSVEEIDFAVEHIISIVTKLKDMAPLVEKAGLA